MRKISNKNTTEEKLEYFNDPMIIDFYDHLRYSMYNGLASINTNFIEWIDSPYTYPNINVTPLDKVHEIQNHFQNIDVKYYHQVASCEAFEAADKYICNCSFDYRNSRVWGTIYVDKVQNKMILDPNFKMSRIDDPKHQIEGTWDKLVSIYNISKMHQKMDLNMNDDEFDKLNLFYRLSPSEAERELKKLNEQDNSIDNYDLSC